MMFIFSLTMQKHIADLVLLKCYHMTYFICYREFLEKRNKDGEI
jgi:hypothetical protein